MASDVFQADNWQAGGPLGNGWTSGRWARLFNSKLVELLAYATGCVIRWTTMTFALIVLVSFE